MVNYSDSGRQVIKDERGAELMSRLLLISYVVVFPFLAASAENSETQQSVQRMSDDKNGLQYLLYLPDNYATQARWPLVLFLHGSGERGDAIDQVKKHGPPKLVAAGKRFPFILVSPQCPRNQRWDVIQLDALLNQLEAKYRVDGNRIYVTGLSMGATGTWAMIAAAPNRFAAIAPICGRGNPGTAKSFATTPTWVFHGAQDPTVPIRESQRMVEALKAAGGQPRFTVYPNAKHDSWTAAYGTAEFYDWLLSQERK